MSCNRIKHFNKNIPSDIKNIYVLENLNKIDNLLFIHHNNNLIISNNMVHFSIYDTIYNLIDIAKIINHEQIFEYYNDTINSINNTYLKNTKCVFLSTHFLPKNLYNLLLSISNIISIDDFYNYYIDPEEINKCKYNNVIYYYLMYKSIIPSSVFNFYNSLIPIDIRIDNIINIPNIDVYLNTMNLINNDKTINDEILNKIRDKQKIFY